MLSHFGNEHGDRPAAFSPTSTRDHKRVAAVRYAIFTLFAKLLPPNDAVGNQEARGDDTPSVDEVTKTLLKQVVKTTLTTHDYPLREMGGRAVVSLLLLRDVPATLLCLVAKIVLPYRCNDIDVCEETANGEDDGVNGERGKNGEDDGVNGERGKNGKDGPTVQEERFKTLLPDSPLPLCTISSCCLYYSVEKACSPSSSSSSSLATTDSSASIIKCHHNAVHATLLQIMNIVAFYFDDANQGLGISSTSVEHDNESEEYGEGAASSKLSFSVPIFQKYTEDLFSERGYEEGHGRAFSITRIVAMLMLEKETERHHHQVEKALAVLLFSYTTHLAEMVSLCPPLGKPLLELLVFTVEKGWIEEGSVTCRKLYNTTRAILRAGENEEEEGGEKCHQSSRQHWFTLPMCSYVRGEIVRLLLLLSPLRSDQRRQQMQQVQEHNDNELVADEHSDDHRERDAHVRWVAGEEFVVSEIAMYLDDPHMEVRGVSIKMLTKMARRHEYSHSAARRLVKVF